MDWGMYKDPSFLKVVTAQEMARIEKWAVQKGASEEKFVEEAGRKVAAAAMEFAEQKKLPKKVLILVGKGNKGADAYGAGAALLEEGYQVRAVSFFPDEDCSGLNRKMRERFKKRRGKVEREIRFHDEGFILDGLLGTGFKGKVEGVLKKAIAAANLSKKPIVSIDIPSGLDGSTGEVRGCAIEAALTVALGLPKIGFFLRQGWNHVGKIRVEDFGLPKEAVEKAECLAYWPLLKGFELPKIVRNRHKYQAGYVVGLGGSEDLKGAPKLSGLAALRTGAGIVRLFHFGDIGPAPVELISNEWNEKKWKEELKRASAVFAGPGLGKLKAGMKSRLEAIAVPAVFDADALLPDLAYPEHAILTPHRGEALRLLKMKHAPEEEVLFAEVLKFCDRKNVIVVLKGAPTFVFVPELAPVIIPFGDPGMATAGMGDVLTGVIAALLAQKTAPAKAAVLGAALHGIAGEIAAAEKTSYGLIAGDVIDCLPKAFQALMGIG